MSSKKGFTFIELMIVIAIIAFLSVLSVPQMMKYLAKAKRSEAYLYLRSLAQAQRLYFAEHGKYTKNIGGAEGLGWKPEGTFNYTYGFVSGVEGEGHFTGQLKTPASHLSGSGISREGFTLMAAGFIYSEKPDIISIDQNHVIKIVSDALS